MKIAAITPLNYNRYNSAQSNNNSNVKNQSTPKTNYNNSPSFGMYIIDDLYHYAKRVSNAKKADFRHNQIENVRKFVHDDIGMVAKRFGHAREEVADRYQQYLDIDGLKPSLDGKEKGLNRVVGYSLEKLELIKNAVVPILTKTEKEPIGVVPNGIIFCGPEGSGKTFMAESFMQHFTNADRRGYWKEIELGTNPYESYYYPGSRSRKYSADWKNGDTDENLEAFWKTFDEEKKDNLSCGHSFVLIRNLDNLLQHPDADLLKTELMYQTENSAKNGITWIGTVTDKKNIPDWLLDTSRTNIIMDLGNTKSDVETSAALSHFMAECGRADETDHKVIIDHLRAKEVPSTPSHIKRIIDSRHERNKRYDYTGEGGWHLEPFTTERLQREINRYSAKLAEQNKKEHVFDDNMFLNND